MPNNWVLRLGVVHALGKCLIVGYLDGPAGVYMY